MENLNLVSDVLKSAIKKCISVDATISGPTEAKNGKQFMKAQFRVVVADDDGYIGQSKLYTKVFFEDSHSLLYTEAMKALEENRNMKILAGRIQIATKKKFYIVGEDGERMKKKDGTYRMGSSITLFLIADENWQTQYQAQCDQITARNAWVEDVVADEEIDAEEEKASNTTEKKGGKNGKK